MANLLALTPAGSGSLVISDQALGKGGEGTVYSVVNHDVPGLPESSTLVAKIYHNPHEGDRANKIKAMVKYAPQSSSVAWPLAVAFSSDRNFVGYIMVKLASTTFRPWSELAHAANRRATASSFDVRYGLTAIRNLAVALSSVHAAGHRVGDINESNIFVGTDARVLLVDTDSAQITTPDGKIYPCLVGKPEYTASEISKGFLRDHVRTPETDVFGLAVASYQMLTGGAHPTDGVFEGAGDPPSVVDRIRSGVFPGVNPALAAGFIHPARIPCAAIPTSIRGVLLRAFSPNSQQRPTLPQFVAAIDQTLHNLEHCSVVQHHWYDKRDGSCGWCTHSTKGLPDPWSDKSSKDQNHIPKQYVLPTVNFGEQPSAPVIRRAPPMQAGQQSPAAYQPPINQPSAPSNPVGALPQSPPPSIPIGPLKTKNGKTILTYTDGSQAVRPPIGVLLRVNPRLALSCLRDETPDIAKFWWPPARNLANKNFLILGMIIASVIGCGWVIFGAWLSTNEVSGWMGSVYKLGGAIAGLGAVMSSIWLTFSGVWDRSRAKKSAGSLKNFVPEPPAKTLGRYVALSIIYGPLLVGGLLAGLVFLMINVLAGLLQDTSNHKTYR